MKGSKEGLTNVSREKSSQLSFQNVYRSAAYASGTDNVTRRSI